MKQLKGFGIKGSKVGGVSKLVFRTKSEANSFSKKVGGFAYKKPIKKLTKLFR